MIEERSIRLLEALEGRTETLLVMLQEERAQRRSLLVQQAELERRLAELEASRLELLEERRELVEERRELVEENRELDEQNRELEEHNRHLHECLAGNEHAAGFARPLRRFQGLAALIGHRAASAAPATRPTNPDPEPARPKEEKGEKAERAPEPAAAPAESSGGDDVSQPAAGQGGPSIGEAPSPQALLNEWYQRYSDAFFKGHTRPLKIGIHEELAAREPWPEKLVRRALACYVNLPRYLKAVREGAERIDLAGQAVGVVDAEAAEHARLKLDRLQSGQRHKPRRGGKNSGKDSGKRSGRGGGQDQDRGQDRGQEGEQGQPLQAAASREPRERKEPAEPASLEEKLSALVAKHNRR